MKVLAEIPARSSPDLRTGTLRRADLEAFTRLLEELSDHRSVLITGEARGRRRASVGLATAAAAAGTRTALLECDLAEPGIAEDLGLASAPGLHEYLRGTAAAEAILKPVVLTGPGSDGVTEPLVCVVAGRPATDATTLLTSERFRHAAANLRNSYELLVIDAPPPDCEPELLATMAVAEATIAWTDRAEAAPRLPAAITGLLVQG